MPGVAQGRKGAVPGREKPGLVHGEAPVLGLEAPVLAPAYMLLSALHADAVAYGSLYCMWSDATMSSHLEGGTQRRADVPALVSGAVRTTQREHALRCMHSLAGHATGCRLCHTSASTLCASGPGCRPIALLSALCA